MEGSFFAPYFLTWRVVRSCLLPGGGCAQAQKHVRQRAARRICDNHEFPEGSVYVAAILFNFVVCHTVLKWQMPNNGQITRPANPNGPKQANLLTNNYSFPGE